MKKIYTIIIAVLLIMMAFSPDNFSDVLHLNNINSYGGVEHLVSIKNVNLKGLSEESGAEAVPATFKLFQNYPNPFNPVTTIKYSLSQESYVSLKVYNTLGNEITTLVDKKLEPGVYTAQFDGRRSSSGVYYVQMKAGDFVNVKKMILLK